MQRLDRNWGDLLQELRVVQVGVQLLNVFREHARKVMVGAAHRLALAGISFLGVAVVGVVLLIFEVVRDRTSGLVAAGFAAVLLLLLETVLPLVLRHRHQD